MSPSNSDMFHSAYVHGRWAWYFWQTLWPSHIENQGRHIYSILDVTHSHIHYRITYTWCIFSFSWVSSFYAWAICPMSLFVGVAANGGGIKKQLSSGKLRPTSWNVKAELLASIQTILFAWLWSVRMVNRRDYCIWQSYCKHGLVDERRQQRRIPSQFEYKLKF